MRPIKLGAIVLISIAVLTVYSCSRSNLEVREAPIFSPGAPIVQQTELVPGPELVARPAMDLRVTDEVLREGQRLYGSYNCSGCHFNGGGGIGPPLMDDKWIYGSDPVNIADTIIEGRPGGMPAYGGRIPAAHVGPIVVYVRSLSGLGDGIPEPTPLPPESWSYPWK